MAILIVEDEFLISDFLCAELTDAGHAVVCAANAAEALVALEAQTSIKAMVTDINMPGTMDGLGLAAVVYRKWPDTRIIVVSGRRAPQGRELPPGAKFVSKPYSPSDMIALVDASATQQ